MSTPADLLRVARADINYVEGGGRDGHSGNITKMWAELEPGYQGQPWCAAAVSYWFRHAGCPLPPIDHPWGYSYCPDLVSVARQRGWVISGPRPGAIALYYFGHAESVHTGVCESGDLGGRFSAIEGNTSPGTSGSQTNGGGVYRRDRLTGGVVFVWPPVYASAPAPPIPAASDDFTPILVNLTAA